MRTSKQSRASKKTEERQGTENLKYMQMAKSKEERVNSNATRCKQPRKKKKGPESTGGEEEVSSGSRCTPCTALCGSRHSNCLPLFLTYFFFHSSLYQSVVDKKNNRLSSAQGHSYISVTSEYLLPCNIEEGTCCCQPHAVSLHFPISIWKQSVIYF